MLLKMSSLVLGMEDLRFCNCRGGAIKVEVKM